MQRRRNLLAEKLLINGVFVYINVKFKGCYILCLKNIIKGGKIIRIIVLLRLLIFFGSLEQWWEEKRRGIRISQSLIIYGKILRWETQPIPTKLVSYPSNKST